MRKSGWMVIALLLAIDGVMLAGFVLMGRVYLREAMYRYYQLNAPWSARSLAIHAGLVVTALVVYSIAWSAWRISREIRQEARGRALR